MAPSENIKLNKSFTSITGQKSEENKGKEKKEKKSF